MDIYQNDLLLPPKSFTDRTLNWIDCDPCLEIEPTLKKILIFSNKDLSVLCKLIEKVYSTDQPKFIALFRQILFVKQPSPSVKPVINHGIHWKFIL